MFKVTRKLGLGFAMAVTICSASWAMWGWGAAQSEARIDLPFGRTGIDVCVSLDPSLVGQFDPGRAALLVKSASEEAVKTPAGTALDLDELRLAVRAGCPHGHLQPSPSLGQAELAAVRGAVEQPSTTSTFVFVVPTEQLPVLEKRGYLRQAYESQCDGHVCSEVTTALFISPSVLQSADELRKALIVGLGIDPSGGEFPNGHSAELDPVTK